MAHGFLKEKRVKVRQAHYITFLNCFNQRGGGGTRGVEEQENRDGRVMERGRGKSENSRSKRVESGRIKQTTLNFHFCNVNNAIVVCFSWS